MADVSRVARKLRTAIQKLATAVEVYHRRLTVDELFGLCASTTASTIGTVKVKYFHQVFGAFIVYFECVTVPLGGFLFEYFLWTASGYAVFRLFQSVVAHTGNDEAIPVNHQNEFMQRSGASFAGWLLLHLGNIDPEVTAEISCFI